MAEKRFYWLKLKDDYFDNPKIKKLRKIAGGDTYTIIYLKMQLDSIKNGGVIQFEHIEQTLEEELALKLDENVDDVSMTLAFLKTQNLIETNDNDEFLLLEASNNIGSEGQSAERKRRFDERKKEKALLCNGDVTNLYISNSISNSNINNRFKKPNIEEIQEYCKVRNSGIDANMFFDFYESKGWKVGNQPMKDWKACIRTWERKNTQKPDFATRNYTKEEMDIFDNLDEVEI